MIYYTGTLFEVEGIYYTKSALDYIVMLTFQRRQANDKRIVGSVVSTGTMHGRLNQFNLVRYALTFAMHFSADH